MFAEKREIRFAAYAAGACLSFAAPTFCSAAERCGHPPAEQLAQSQPCVAGVTASETGEASDAAGLAKAIAGLTLPVELVGTDVRSWAPLADEAAAWYAAAMDGSHVIRSSTAVIVDGVLHVQSGPLVGQEPRISKVDRHRRRCQVRVGDGDAAFTEQAPIDVPFKS